MKPYCITKGAFSHARTSIAHHRARSNRELNPDGTTDPTRRATGDAPGLEASDQAMGRAPSHLSALWAQAAPTGRNDAPGDRDDVRTCGGAATTLSLSRVWAPLVSGQWLVQRAQGRNHQCASARSGHAGRLLVALSGGERPAEEAQWSPDQCGRDPSADQSGRPATGRATASGGRAGLLLSCDGDSSSTAGRATPAGGVGWRLGV